MIDGTTGHPVPLMPYPPWRQDLNAHISVEVVHQQQWLGDGHPPARAGRTRIVIEGLDERVAPYFEAVTELVAKEKGTQLVTPHRGPGV